MQDKVLLDLVVQRNRGLRMKRRELEIARRRRARDGGALRPRHARFV
jgi:hypothetical protein